MESNKLSYNVPGEGRQELMSVKAETGKSKVRKNLEPINLDSGGVDF